MVVFTIFTSKYSNFENAASVYFKTIEAGIQSDMNEVLNEITAMNDSVVVNYDLMLKNETIKDNGFSMLETIRKTNNEIGNSTKNYLATKNDTTYTFELLSESDQRQVGTIKHSLESGFVKWVNPTATLFSSFFSVIIDIIPLGFLFLVFPYTKGGNRDRRRPQKRTL